MRKSILIFYISEQSGHFHAARAVEKALHEATSGRVDTTLVNALDYTNPILGKVINRAYLEVIKKRPHVWGHMYDNPKVLKNTKKARESIHKYNMSKIKKLLGKFSPDVVLCTQAFPCGMVADYKRTSGNTTTLIGILTDHAPHSYWLYDEVDYYVIPSKETVSAFEKKGVPGRKLLEFGIPIDLKFCRSHDKKRVLRDLGLEEGKPVILIMGGSQGLGAIREVVSSLLKDEKHSYQLIVVTGTNRKLYRQLVRARKKRSGRLDVLRFVDNIDELMEASDVVITKAGGITTAEAVAKKLPLFIVKPIPGHERMNADFLIKAGAAIEIDDYSDLHEKINAIFDARGILEKMRRNAEEISKPDSASRIAELVLKEG